jgi:flagellar protein FlaG
MDGIVDVASQQQTQMVEAQGRANQEVQQTQQTQDVVKEVQDKVSEQGTKVTSQDQVEDLVKELNKAMEPMHTNLKFGVDSKDIFYVSVIEQNTNKMIRRFPAEQAADFLPKMQEVSGILFDTKG